MNLAPNGKPSNLTPEQYRLVRTPAFKKWFGDWENSPETASKVIDENGEPLVVYRGSKTKNPNYTPHTHISGGIFFSTNKEVAKLYIESVWQNWIGRVFDCFLNIKKIENFNALNFKTNIYQGDFKFYDSLVLKSKQKFNGLKWENIIDVPNLDIIYPKEPNDFIATTYVVFEPNQIKLADGTNTTFDSNNPDIRFKTGGSIRKPKKRTISQTPAPKKDRIYGSKINKPKSSESKSKASSIILSPSVIKSIRTIINKHNEEYPNKKVPLSSAKAVVRRGMGAYSSTHRPTISGGKPNSRVAWGLARLNAFIYKIKKGKSKSGKYKQDDDLINELGYKVKPYAFGGQITDEQKETYKKWKELVNMSRSELEKFYNSEEGKIAGLSAKEAKEQGIDSGRESARWIMKMKYVPVKEWNSNMWRWAKKQISFISRMSGMKGKLYDEKGRKTRKHLALLIWGHNPEK